MITRIVAASGGYHATACPTLQRDSAGVLWASWATGTNDASMDYFGSVALLLNGQWTTPTVILAQGDASGADLLMTLALVNGALWAIYGHMTNAQSDIVLHYRVLTQSAGVVSVGAQQTFNITNGTFSNAQAYSPIIRLGSGRLLMGLGATDVPNPTNDDFLHYIARSDDAGATWQVSSEITPGLEPMAVVLGGKQLAILRSSKIAVCESADNFQTFGSVVQSTLPCGDNRVRARMITGGPYDGMVALSSTNNASSRLDTTTWIVSAWTGTDFTVVETIAWSNVMNPYRQSYPDGIVEDSTLRGIVGITVDNLTVMNIEKGTSSAHAGSLEFSTQPGDATAGDAFGQQPVVTVKDTNGATLTTFTGIVTMAKASGPGTLSGTLTKAGVAGVATFTNLELDTEGDYTLEASIASPALAVESASFAVATPSIAPDGVATLDRLLRASEQALANNDPVDDCDDQSAANKPWHKNSDPGRPTYKTAIINSKAVYRFGASSSMYGLSVGTTGNTGFYTLGLASVGAGAWAMVATAGSQYWRYSDGYGYWGLYRGARLDNYPEVVPASGNHIFTEQSGASFYELFIDGVSQGKRPPNFSAPTFEDMTPGAQIDVAEVDQYTSVLSLSNVNGIHAWLGDATTGYNIPINQTPGNDESSVWAYEAAAILEGTEAWEMQGGFGNVFEPSVIQKGPTEFIMSYTGGYTTTIPSIGIARSTDGITWTQDAANPRVGNGNGGEASDAQRSCLVWAGGDTFHIYYSDDSGGGNIQRVTSTDNCATFGSKTLILDKASAPAPYTGYANSQVMNDGGTWRIWVEAFTGTTFNILYATGADGVTFSTPDGPISALQRGTGMYGGPNVIKVGSVYHMWHHACTGVLGNPLTPTNIYHAITSTPDVFASYLKIPNPVLYNGEQADPISGSDQIGDPCVIPISGGYRIYLEQVKNSNPENNILSATIAEISG